MPDYANARLALRQLVADLAQQIADPPPPLPLHPPTIDEALAGLDEDQAAQFQKVWDALNDGDRDQRGRFVYVVTENDFRTAAARRVVIVDTEGADGHGGYEATFIAQTSETAKARTIVDTLNEHPPAPPVPYDEEPF